MKRIALLLAAVAMLIPAACDKGPNTGTPAATGGAEKGALEAIATVEAGGKVAVTGKNSTITFVGTKLEGKHDGGFKEFKGEISTFVFETGVNPKDAPGTITGLTIEIDATSLYSDDEKLTNHLKNEDFFDIKSHPTIKFVSTGVARIGESMDHLNVTGDLTLRGVTKSITIPVKIVKDKLFHLSSEFKINRMDFGMMYGEGKVDNEVSVKVTVGKAPQGSAK